MLARIMHPRAERYFAGGSAFEDFIFTVVHGARWKVVAGIVGIVASGVALALQIAPRAPGPWGAVVVAKVALLATSLALFIHVSWVLWPRRVFASAAELPAVRRRLWWLGTRTCPGGHVLRDMSLGSGRSTRAAARDRGSAPVGAVGVPPAQPAL